MRSDLYASCLWADTEEAVEVCQSEKYQTLQDVLPVCICTRWNVSAKVAINEYIVVYVAVAVRAISSFTCSPGLELDVDIKNIVRHFDKVNNYLVVHKFHLFAEDIYKIFDGI